MKNILEIAKAAHEGKKEAFYYTVIIVVCTEERFKELKAEPKPEHIAVIWVNEDRMECIVGFFGSADDVSTFVVDDYEALPPIAQEWLQFYEKDFASVVIK